MNLLLPLAKETNKAFAGISDDTHRAFYIQGDEVIHEKYLDTIYRNMSHFKENQIVDGLLFHYLHFYGSYDYVGTSSKWYRNEIRIIKNNKSIYAYRDAQGFRKQNNLKLNVKPIDAYVYHYGWVREPKAMQKKQENFHKYWHDDQWIEKNIIKAGEFDYRRNLDSLRLFDETHPKVMKKRIEAKNWKFEYDISFNNITGKDKIKNFLKKSMGFDFSCKNYRII